MEKREDFKRVVEGINQLEQQLLSIVEDGKVNDKDFAEAEEEVERYFSRCEQALAARKEGLLRELAQKLTDQSMSSSISFSPPLLSFVYPLQKEKAVMDAQEEVNKAIKARKKMLKAGSYVYEIEIKSAEHAWKVWWPSSLLFHTALSLFSFCMISFSPSPSYNRCLILHTLNSSFWMQGATNLPWPQASVGRMKLDLSSSFFELIQALGKGISPSVYILITATND